PQVRALAAAHPGVTFVLDHFAGARIHADDHADWRTQLEPVAALPNTVMKVSGYLTAADPMPPSIDTLRPFFETALDLFGPARLMYGSDWPVCLRGGSYEAGVQMLQTLAGALTLDEQLDLWGRTATKTYQL
ncbi:MAG: amidohydrolase, partial [Anaerolineae bacterium]|nr:amidohydrolase [Anaerolineae bacterium]